MSNTTQPSTYNSYQERILRVLVHIQQHLDDTLALDELARIAHFSAYHFHRIFRGMVGESVAHYVRRLRLERAAHRLKFTDQQVTRIAFDSGYETLEAFSRKFHLVFGESPSRYRELQADTRRNSTQVSMPTPTLPRSTPAAVYDVRIERIDPLHVAFVRHVGPYDQVGSTWQKLFAWVFSRGLFGTGTSVIGICHDDSEVTPVDRIRYDAAITVEEGTEPQGDVGVQQLVAGEYARICHQGPYEQLGNAYVRVCGGWAPTSGRELRSAPALEFYRNSPMDTAPEFLITDVYLPLQSR